MEGKKERGGGRKGEKGRENNLVAVFCTARVLKHETHYRVKVAKDGYCNERRYRATLVAQGGGEEWAKEH